MTFLVLPMQGAVASADINISEEIEIIAGDFTQKRTKLSRILKINEEYVNNIMEHTKNSRSNDFFRNPILIYKTQNNYIEAHHEHVRIANYMTCFFNIAYWAYCYPHHKINIVEYVLNPIKKYFDFRPDTREINQHMIVVDSKTRDFMIHPFRPDYSFKFELDCIQNNKQFIETIAQFERILYKTNALSMRIKRASSFFNKAIYFDKLRSNPVFDKDINSDTLLFLHTCLECMIVKNSYEEFTSKKIREYLNKIIELDPPKGYDNILDFVKYITRSRGKYIHAGEKYIEKNIVTIHDIDANNKHLTDLETLTKIVAITLCKHISIISQIHNNKKINEYDYEKEFFKKIDKTISIN